MDSAYVRVEKIGNVELDYSFYRGEDLYSDGEIEDEILEACKNKKENELLKQSKDYAVLYHLSEIRHNLIEWYPIGKDESVLEIGAGCGGVTGVLSQKAGFVTCVELSMKRSRINAYRHSDRDNVRIIIGNYQEIEPSLGKFDVITLIGVWEYSNLYISGKKDAYVSMLEIAKRHLTDNGRLFIAIENKTGLRYWNGAFEDHTGKQYSGLNDYSDGENVRTFSKNEIENLLRRVGVNDWEFHYPIPDYKLPVCIYSDNYLPQPGDIRSFHDNYDTVRFYSFNEAAVYDQVCEDGMFPYFSNSFVITTGNESGVDYVKYNRNRRKEFRTAIKIIREKSRISVCRESLYIESNKHIASMPIKYKYAKDISAKVETGELINGKFISEYIGGKSLEHELYSFRNDVNGFIDKCKEFIEMYIRKYLGEYSQFENTNAFISTFGMEYPFESWSRNNTNIDSSFSNYKRIYDGSVGLFDYEWCFSFPIPEEYVIWRALHHIYGVYRMYLKKEIDEEEFVGCFEISREQNEVFLKMENGFQKYVYGSDYYPHHYIKPAFMNEMRGWK